MGTSGYPLGYLPTDDRLKGNDKYFESLFLGFLKEDLLIFSLNNFSRFQIFLDFIILSCYS